MTPFIKALEIRDKFYNLDIIRHESDGGGGDKDAVELALILVKEQIELLQELYYNGSMNNVLADKIEELIDVQLELDKL